MRGVVLLMVVGCLLIPTLSPAGEPPVPIEGLMLVTSTAGSFFLEGSSDNTTPCPLPGGQISPLADQLTYESWDVWEDNEAEYQVSIRKANIDGTNEVNLTALAGLGAVNCFPSWSPDGSEIAFRRCVPIEGQLPCLNPGFQLWVMGADGTNAHRVSPELDPPELYTRSWSPNGYRLLFEWAGSAVIIDSDGTDMELLPNVGHSAYWSPDGSKIASSWSEAGDVGGQTGVWRQLCLTDVETGEREVLWEHFVPDSVVEAACPGDAWHQNDLRVWAGPHRIQWSPRGDRLAFIGLYPFEFASVPLDVSGENPEYLYDLEVYIYDIDADDLTQITDNANFEGRLSWNGHNTYPEDPEVTVDNTTVTFSDVGDDGLTTIIRDDDPPDLPGGYEFCEEFYDISTTASIEGPISICMTYDDADVPTGTAEADLAILHYVEDGGYWEDVTVSVDTEANVVCGETDSLSVFTLSGLRPEFFLDVPVTGFGVGGVEPHWA
ncbi:MAG: PD40 domain-containing protein, partial [Armatimonadetes bacterium]|nr:PD40 domain-containing protein [Armatimonadota bacterium]